MIISKTNEYIKHIKSLSQKKYRDEYHEFIIEGIKLVKEALEDNIHIKKIIICKELFDEKIEFDNIEYVDEKIFKYISETETPQGILAVVEQKENEELMGNIIFALENVQDPGNLGTIIRTLDCAGINSLILSSGCADLYNPKVVRSTMGAIFRVNITRHKEFINKLLELKEKGYKIIVTSLQTEKYIYDLNLMEKCIIVIGNESKGVSNDIMQIADIKTKIPMIGKTESLNAGVAASIIAYEVLRQKL